MSSVRARAAWCLLALGLGAAGTGCGGTPPGETVTILVPWAQESLEYRAFQKVVEPFEREFDIQILTSRALTQQLDADLAADDPPDLVDLTSPAAVDNYEGDLKPLAIDLSSYSQPWQGLAKLGTGKVYAVPVKADVKSLIWYRRRVLRSPPASWAALENFSRHGTPWCLGLASGPTSGWPGADWVADILLSRYHATTYENWLDGQLLWTSRDLTYAWNTWGELMRNGAGINGGAPAALTTGFTEIESGRCELQHGALSATGLKSTAGYDYVRFPAIAGTAAPILVSGDFMGRFTDNPNAEKLLTYLASRRAQTLWVQQPGGYAFSADQAVKPGVYPAGVQQQIAKLLQPADNSMLCFSAEDMMLPDMTTAFEQAVLDYVDTPASLPTLLNGMQQTQQGVGSSPPALAKSACAQP